MSNEIKGQARELYRTVRILKGRICHRFEERARHGVSGDKCGDITFAQMNVLMAITERGELALKALAEMLHVSPPSASSMVDRLVELGMVVREQSTVDRREVRIRLSEVGEAQFQAMEDQILECIADLLTRLGPALSLQWCEVYTRIREIIESEIALEMSQENGKDAVG